MDAIDMKNETLKKIDARIKRYSEDRDQAFKSDKMIKYAALGMLVGDLNLLRLEIEEIPVS